MPGNPITRNPQPITHNPIPQILFIPVNLLLVLLLAAAGMAQAETLSIVGPMRDGLLEGETYPIEWKSEGIKSVTVVAYGVKTPLGGRSRGYFTIVISKPVPAEQGSVKWTVPWIDSISLTVKLKGYDSTGRLVKINEKPYGFRPAVMANRSENGIFLDLHKRTDQRLYVQKNRRITHVYLSSSSENYLWMPANKHPSKPHDHAGVFKVLDKSPDHWSQEFHVHMYWAMHYLGGHYIHATSPNLYRYLGTPASHGCNRLTRYDAKQLYDTTPLGTRVEVIGPKG